MPDVGNFGTIVSLVVLGVTWIIFKPLQQSIVDLKESIKELKEEVKVSRKEIADIRERVAKCEGSTASAHKRIDAVAKVVDKYHEQID